MKTKDRTFWIARQLERKVHYGLWASQIHVDQWRGTDNQFVDAAMNLALLLQEVLDEPRS